MQGDCEHFRAMRLLPFAAAADKPCLTLKQVTLSSPSSGKTINSGHWCSPEGFDGHIESVSCGGVAALYCCTVPVAALREAEAVMVARAGRCALSLTLKSWSVRPSSLPQAAAAARRSCKWA